MKQKDLKNQKTNFRQNGKDEMNLAEFPFAVLSDKGKSRKAMIFTDHIKGKNGKLVLRKWTVTASEQFGMPTRDDERIYIGLMQITKENRFEELKQYFTRYHLLKLIGWPTNSGVYYKRVERALDRLMGVAIKAENAFYDTERKAYTTESFHIIDNYGLWDKEASDGQRTLPLSFFKWNEVIWRSIKNGYIKNLDTKFWFSLESAIARRLYRYLDKKFYYSRSFNIDLKVLAFEKLGMSRSYAKPSKIKALINPACEELVEKGYLKTYRYEKDQYGNHAAIFVQLCRGRQERLLLSGEQLKLKNELVVRGVSEVTATDLISDYDIKKIGEKIEIFDYLKETGSLLLTKNPGGYLRKSIEDDYMPPKGFMTQEEKQKEVQKAEEMERRKKGEQEKRIYLEWLMKSPAERWNEFELKLSFRERHGHQPTMKEIAEARKAYLENPENPEEYQKRIFGKKKYPVKP